MSRRTPGPTALLILYPATWRGRYGDELDALILDMHADGRNVGWRVRADLLRAALRVRLDGGRGSDPGARIGAGTSLVLWAWALFVLAGPLVAKTSEHWQQALPAHTTSLAHGAFAALIAIAVATAAVVAVGLALLAPAAARRLRDGGWPLVRPRVRRAAALTAAWLPATVALVVWAHQLDAAARTGHDHRYAAAFAVWASLSAATLLAWTAVATRLVRITRGEPAMLRAHALVAPGITIAMAAMTAATALWWAIVGARAPSALTGGSAAAHPSALVPGLALAGALMLAATLLAAAGAARARRALAELEPSGQGR